MQKLIHIQYYQSPCGRIILGSLQNKLCLSDWINSRHREITDKRIQQAFQSEYIEDSSLIIQEAQKQLDEYFEGNRKYFNIPLLWAGTEFQQSVWNELTHIPYGETISYQELAQRLDRPRSVRAVANAIGKNPLSIIVPCHRVIGSNQTLTGFSGGLAAKEFLLKLEKKEKCL